jgi:hypothetical protein
MQAWSAAVLVVFDHQGLGRPRAERVAWVTPAARVDSGLDHDDFGLNQSKITKRGRF